ncbi:hypothetical protein [Kitasatospora sp. NPDC057738]|uniref:hypothetical protein n=1 Tax=Kitasatospora sp. NPDC057738 TaxID=3346233 RepID=UPI003689D7DB
MTDTPPSLPDADLADIRTRFERTTEPGWRDVTDIGRLLGEIDRLRAEVDRQRHRWAKSQDRAWESHLAAEAAAETRDQCHAQLRHAQQALADVQAEPDSHAARIVNFYAALTSLGELHHPTYWNGRQICPECQRRWPCRTSTAIAAACDTTS